MKMFESYNPFSYMQSQPLTHPELSGCITTLIDRNTGLQTFVQQWTP